MFASVVTTVLAVQLALAVGQSPQPRDPLPTRVTGTGSISGRVTSADTGAPIRRGLVTLSGGAAKPIAALTDVDGRFVFRNLPAGSYIVMATAGPFRGGYLGGGHGVPFVGRGGPSVTPTPVELADGEQRGNVDIALVRAGVIVGVVTDGAGDPMSRVQVSALSVRRGFDGFSVGVATTDDLGQYRLFGLAPGEYVVSASTRGGGFMSSAEIQADTVAFPVTYAPGTTSLADAGRVKVTRGGLAIADIRMLETRAYVIKGRVTTSSGDVSRNLNVSMAIAGGLRFQGASGAAVMPDGSFAFRDVVPGRYEITAVHTPPDSQSLPPPSVSYRAPDYEVGVVTIEVHDADLENVVLVTQPGATVIGEIAFEDGQTGARRAQIYTQAADANAQVSASVEVKDLTFTLRNVFRPLLIRGAVMRSEVAAESWGLKGVFLNGQDITDELRLFTSADSGKLKVVFTSRAASLEGTVTDEAGKPVQQCTVLLFGEDPATWRFASSMIRMTRPGKDSKWTLRGLREGSYRVVAVLGGFPMSGNAPDKELLESLSRHATAVVLNPGDTRTVELRVTPFQQ